MSYRKIPGLPIEAFSRHVFKGPLFAAMLRLLLLTRIFTRGHKHLLQRLVRNLLDAVKLFSIFEVTTSFPLLIRSSSPKKEKKRK